MAEQFTNPDDRTIRDLLERARTVAVLGLSSNPGRPSFGVARAMQHLGYRMIPVNPNEREVLGVGAAAELSELREPIDLVDVFRAPEHVPAIVEQCLALGLPALWLQEGVVAPKAAARAREGGMTVIMDRCLLKERHRLL